MQDLISALGRAFASKRVWTAIVLALINGIAEIRDQIPPNLIGPIDAVLALLAIVFGVKRKPLA